VKGDARGAAITGLRDACAMSDLHVMLLPGHLIEQRLSGCEQFRVGARVYRLQFVFHRLPAPLCIGLLLKFVDCPRDIAIAAKLFFQQRLQSIITFGDGFFWRTRYLRQSTAQL
jgi:hypothetical protein